MPSRGAAAIERVHVVHGVDSACMTAHAAARVPLTVCLAYKYVDRPDMTGLVGRAWHDGAGRVLRRGGEMRAGARVWVR